MKYVIDLTKLKKLGINANQTILLYLLANKEEKELVSYIKSCGLFSSSDIDILVQKNLIINNNEPEVFIYNKFEVTESCLDFLDIGKNLDNFTDELWKNFPGSTPSGRKLKQVSKKTIELLYNKCHNNNLEEHKKIVQLLQREVEERRNKGLLDYMQGIKTWLHNRSYLAYEEESNENSTSLITQYGNKLL